MIGKKPSNPIGIEEKNQDKKDLIVIHLYRINLCS